jgi:hypothetical protein
MAGQFLARQGDVLVIRIPEIPTGVKPEEGLQEGDVTLAHGEQTGHAHRIRSRYVKMFVADGARYLRVTRPAALEHEEHGRIDLPAGTYQVIRQMEYTPQSIRHVAD